MVAAVAISPVSGSIISKTTACRITCSGVANNTATGYDTTHYPASPAVNYVFEITKSGSDDLVSEKFSTNPGGTAEWNDVIFPSAGTWTLAVENADTDATIVSASVVVS